MSPIGHQLFRIARRGPLDAVIRLAFAHAAPLLPLPRLALTPSAIAVRHPRPVSTTHVLIVPRRAIRSLVTIGERDAPAVIGCLELADRLARERPGTTLLVNGGAAQDIGQLHAHLILDDADVTRRVTWPIALTMPLTPEILAASIATVRALVATHDLEPDGYSLIVPPHPAAPGLDWAGARLAARRKDVP